MKQRNCSAEVEAEDALVVFHNRLTVTHYLLLHLGKGIRILHP